MQTGYVFKTQGDGFFGILVYGEKYRVMMRVMKTTSVYDACTMLGAQFAGRFVPADSDQQAWARAITNKYPALLLTDS